MSLDHYVPQLSRPSTVEQLAKALGVAVQVFNAIADHTDPQQIYRQHKIPKRASGAAPMLPVVDDDGVIVLDACAPRDYRVVWEAYHPVYKRAHKTVARVLERYLARPSVKFPHEAAYGYVKGRSTRHNARRHLGAKRILSADIQDFFPSITQARVELALNGAGFNSSITNALARFLSIEGSLPLGLNASPLIANLVATPLDIEMSALAKQWGLTYTRYADDITLSGNGSLPTAGDIEAVFKRHFFRLNKAKFRTSKLGQKHYVTGLSVADKAAPHAPRSMKRKLRQELYYIEKFGFLDHYSKAGAGGTEQNLINRVDGMVSYVSSIEARTGRRLREDWARISRAQGLSRSFEPRSTPSLRHAYWFVDEAEIVHPDGMRLLALCLADILEPARMNMELVSLFAEEAGDAFGTADAISIIEKGLHWTQATWSQREAVVKVLSASSMRAMVAIAPLPNPKDYASVYLRLLAKLLKTMLKTADDATVALYIEENRSKVSEVGVRSAVASVYAELTARNQRRPLQAPDVEVLAKGATPCSCVPDTMLGALQRYALSRSEHGDSGLAVILFERLRTRYSVIFDEHANKIHHHRVPFPRW